MKKTIKHSGLKKGLIAGLAGALVLGSTVAVFASTDIGKTTDDTAAESVNTVAEADEGEEALSEDFEYEFDEDYDYDYDEEDYIDEDCEIDYGELTDEEIAELESIYDQMNEVWDSIFPEDLEDISDEEFDALYDQYLDEIKDLEEQALAYEVKAGWYGNLTVSEVMEMNSIYDQMNDIFDSIFTDDIDELSDEEFDALYDQYYAAVEDLEDQVLVYEVKAGWYGDLTLEEAQELYNIYDQMDEVWDSIFTGDLENLSDEEFDALYDQYDEAVKDLEERAEELEEKAGWDYECDCCEF